MDMREEPSLEKFFRKEHEQKLRAVIGLSDAERSAVSLLHDQWSPIAHYMVGDVRRRGEDLYKCLIEHNAQISWKPEDAPSLWVKIMYKDGIRIIEENIPADNPFYPGDLGWWGNVLYRSILPTANVYNPEQYPQGWEEVEQ